MVESFFFVLFVICAASVPSTSLVQYSETPVGQSETLISDLRQQAWQEEWAGNISNLRRLAWQEERAGNIMEAEAILRSTLNENRCANLRDVRSVTACLGSLSCDVGRFILR